MVLLRKGNKQLKQPSSYKPIWLLKDAGEDSEDTIGGSSRSTSRLMPNVSGSRQKCRKLLFSVINNQMLNTAPN